MTDNCRISASSLIFFPAVRQACLCKRLWLGAGGVVLFMAIVFGARALRPQASAPTGPMGLDFVAFYTAGAAVREGRTHDLYNLSAANRFQQTLQREQEVAIGGRFAPWWNPPFYSLLFVPLSHLPFHVAFVIWSTLSIVCAVCACILLSGILPAGADVKSRALVPVLVVISTPFIATLTHGQNSCISLLLLTIAVLLWRSGKPLAAGLAGGLLFYKPQLALVIAAVMILDLGWRPALGYAITVAALLALNVVLLPGSLTAFVHQVPLNLDLVQSQLGYPWERHVTFKAFWRMLLQGNEPGATRSTAAWLGTLCAATFGTLLARTAIKVRAGGVNPVRRDRLIAATIAITPVLMPFYFDYDLLLLAVPAVLVACEMWHVPAVAARLLSAGRGGVLLIAWGSLYIWMMVNPDVAERFHVNLAVPLLALVSLALLRRVDECVAALDEAQVPAPLSRSTSPR